MTKPDDNSEENSYGLVLENWFEGRIDQPIVLPPGSHKLHIDEVKEYQGLDSSCSDDSYYRCLAKRFERRDFCQYNNELNLVSNMEYSKSECETRETCTPYSLPFTNKMKVCKELAEEWYHKVAFWILQSDKNDSCPRSCKVKEYLTTLDYSDTESSSDHEFKLEYKFNSLLRGSRNQRTKIPQKIVKKEHMIVSLSSLVGNVGGTLGMFVGFSFIGATESLLTVLGDCWKKITAKSPKK